eukprot:CAMPEP_0194394890 /NCGR_PEP_ID=MMETSP0174-20130528/124106_1 /TAXON_ID=216777 /ORGANISM="Proboscia alata, Strain PI-D3" /LENGTH=105 /DNA_ID=CAMNT_0039190739 /DNA_START=1382 /DNA_END=1699 /DNA_ORIENTATION=-
MGKTIPGGVQVGITRSPNPRLAAGGVLPSSSASVSPMASPDKIAFLISGRRLSSGLRERDLRDKPKNRGKRANVGIESAIWVYSTIKSSPLKIPQMSVIWIATAA